MEPLPNFERPPVVEIVAAVQSLPVGQFSNTQAVSIAREFPEWPVVDAGPALPPIHEAANPVQSAFSAGFTFGEPPLRVVLNSPDNRWTVQAQHDRVAVHERKTELDGRPSFEHVQPELRKTITTVRRGLDESRSQFGLAPELVELTYINDIAAGDVWSSVKDLHHALNLVTPPQVDVRGTELDQLSIQTVYRLTRESGDFAGRLYVAAQPTIDDSNRLYLHLRLTSRRYFLDDAFEDVLEAAHRDIVETFAAVTTPDMHNLWGKY